MEMQFSIIGEIPSPGGLSLKVAVSLVTEMGDTSIPAKETEAVTDSEMGISPSHAEEPGQLFERLTGLRRQIASEAGLPPYIIFHDSTLLEMCRAMPKDLQDMKAVPGVGEVKLSKYGQRFLDAIQEYALPEQQS